jgi:hypothetical protein
MLWTVPHLIGLTKRIRCAVQLDLGFVGTSKPYFYCGPASVQCHGAESISSLPFSVEYTAGYTLLDNCMKWGTYITQERNTSAQTRIDEGAAQDALEDEILRANIPRT